MYFPITLEFIGVIKDVIIIECCLNSNHFKAMSYHFPCLDQLQSKGIFSDLLATASYDINEYHKKNKKSMQQQNG